MSKIWPLREKFGFSFMSDSVPYSFANLYSDLELTRLLEFGSVWFLGPLPWANEQSNAFHPRGSFPWGQAPTHCKHVLLPAALCLLREDRHGPGCSEELESSAPITQQGIHRGPWFNVGPQVWTWEMFSLTEINTSSLCAPSDTLILPIN